MRLIGLVGRARHGKDSAASVLVAERGFRRYAFADALREMALGIDPYVTATMTLSELVQMQGWDEAKKHERVRRFLQRLGTEGVRRVFGDDAWVNVIAKRLASERPSNAVITDVRFPNEAGWVRGRGGQLWKIIRTNPDGSQWDNGIGVGHASEQYIDSIRVDKYIEACTLQELHDSTRKAVDYA